MALNLSSPVPHALCIFMRRDGVKHTEQCQDRKQNVSQK